MSVAVGLDRLREEVGRFGTTPYLVTVSDDGRPHTVSVSIWWEGDALVASVGSRTSSNAGARPLVSLLWPPVEAGGYGLIVDGTAQVRPSDASVVDLTPTSAVLHRTAGGAGGSDCLPVLRP